ncbi:MAG: RNA polymerase sigma factor [Balneolaceae bacterium]
MDQPIKEEFKSSISELYPRLHRAMKAYVAGSSVDPEDVVQEAFLKGYKNLKRFQRNSTLYTWLYSIARNIAIDEFRKRKYEKLQSNTPVEEFEIASNPESDEDNKEQMILLRKAIAELPGLLRSVVVMKTIDGLSYPEMSEITGVNEETLKNRMFRARKLLSTRLKQLGIHQS